MNNEFINIFSVYISIKVISILNLQFIIQNGCELTIKEKFYLL